VQAAEADVVDLQNKLQAAEAEVKIKKCTV